MRPRSLFPLVLLTFVCVSSSSARAEDVLLTDDFERATLGPDWLVEGFSIDLTTQVGRDGTGHALHAATWSRWGWARVARTASVEGQDPAAIKIGEIWAKVNSLLWMSESYSEIELFRLTDGSDAATVWTRPEIAYVGIDRQRRLFLRYGKGSQLIQLDIGPFQDLVPLGSWHHLQVTYDPAAPRVELAIDGTVVKETTDAAVLGLLDGRIGGVGFLGIGSSAADVAFDDLRIVQVPRVRNPVVTLPPLYEFRTAPDDTRGEAWATLLGTIQTARGGTLTCTWTEGGSVLATSTAIPVNGAAEAPFAGFLSVGTHEIDLHVAEPGAGEASAHTQVTVIDATPPRLWVGPQPGVLWPPDHKMVGITPSIVVTDNVDDAPRVELLSVTSSEPDDAPGAGDGATTGDISIGPGGAVSLRAERDGRGPGRTYTFHYAATDAAGNRTLAEATVTVPHDMR